MPRLLKSRITLIHQGQVVRKVDNTIHCINPFPVDNIIGLPNTYPLDSDLSSIWHYSTIKQPESGNIIIMMLGRMLSTICIIPHIPLSFILIILLIIWLLFCFQVRKYVQGFIKPGLTMIEIW